MEYITLGVSEQIVELRLKLFFGGIFIKVPNQSEDTKPRTKSFELLFIYFLYSFYKIYKNLTVWLIKDFFKVIFIDRRPFHQNRKTPWGSFREQKRKFEFIFRVYSVKYPQPDPKPHAKSGDEKDLSIKQFVSLLNDNVMYINVNQ